MRKTKTAEPARVHRIVLWRIWEQTTDEWYIVFATSRAHAVQIVVDTHYPEMQSRAEYCREHKVKTSRVRDDERLVVSSEDSGTETKTASEWCQGETAGPFCSSTYEV